MHANGEAAGRRKPRLYLWHGERSDGVLAYMYEPPRASLLAGLEAYHNKAAWDLRVGIIGDRQFANATSQLSDLMPGDVFLWLGWDKSFSVPWSSLRQQGAYTIYYQSEPLGHCAFFADEVDEIWDFSWYNIDGCQSDEKIGKRAPTLRYVPLAALSKQPTAIEDACGKPVFFGATVYRPCWDAVLAQFRRHIKVIYSVWNEGAFNRMLNSSSIFVNLHKNCDNRRYQEAPITWRNAKLLNSRGLIVSERCYPKDEAEFEGMISFVPRNDMYKEYLRICSLTKVERRALASARSSSFAKKFEPALIFQRAGVYDMLERVASAPRPNAVLVAADVAPTDSRLRVLLSSFGRNVPSAHLFLFVPRGLATPLRAARTHVVPSDIPKGRPMQLHRWALFSAFLRANEFPHVLVYDAFDAAFNTDPFDRAYDLGSFWHLLRR